MQLAIKTSVIAVFTALVTSACALGPSGAAPVMPSPAHYGVQPQPSETVAAGGTAQRFDVGARMSEMAVHNGVCYLAGQVAEDGSQDIGGQTRQVLAAIDALLAKAGSDKTRILRAQIFLADIADIAGMNQAWDAWVVAGHTPPRATVQASLAKPEWKVEIVVTAAV